MTNTIVAPTFRDYATIAGKALSPREIECLQYVVNGLTNEEIAVAMSPLVKLSINTILTLRQNIVRKLQVRDITGAVVMGLVEGLVTLPAPRVGEGFK